MKADVFHPPVAESLDIESTDMESYLFYYPHFPDGKARTREEEATQLPLSIQASVVPELSQPGGHAPSPTALSSAVVFDTSQPIPLLARALRKQT